MKQGVGPGWTTMRLGEQCRREEWIWRGTEGQKEEMKKKIYQLCDDSYDIYFPINNECKKRYTDWFSNAIYVHLGASLVEYSAGACARYLCA